MSRIHLSVLVTLLVGSFSLTACVPPSCPDPDADDGGGGDDDDDDDDDDKPFPDEDRLEERKADNCLTDSDACEGYPDENDEGYGFAKGQTLQNWVLFDCEGEEREFAELLNKRPDNGLYNKGMLIALGAGWCGPCKKESEHLAEMAPEYRDEQIEFLHVLHQGMQLGQLATNEVCEWWNTEVSDGSYLIWYDAEDQIADVFKENPLDAIPYTVLVDANANVRVRQPPPEFPEDQLIEALQRLINNPYGD